MNNLVTIDNDGITVTTSLKIAEVGFEISPF